MQRISFLALASGAVALILGGCGGGGSGLSVPAIRSSDIVFVSDRGATPGTGHTNIYRMNADGSNQTRITNSTEDDFSPHLSRDGKTIVFVIQSGGTANTAITADIFKINADGTGRTQLTFSNGSSANASGSPAISPDGRTIVYLHGANDLWQMDISGQNQRLLSQTNAPYYGPTFSPDGSSLACQGTQSGQEVLVVRNLATGNEQIINPTRQSSYISAPHYSPDGKQLIYLSSSFPPITLTHGTLNPRADVSLIKADGSDAKTPTRLATNLYPAADVRFNPLDGTLILESEGPLADYQGLVSGPQIAAVDAKDFGNTKLLTSLGSNSQASFAE